MRKTFQKYYFIHFLTTIKNNNNKSQTKRRKRLVIVDLDIERGEITTHYPIYSFKNTFFTSWPLDLNVVFVKGCKRMNKKMNGTARKRVEITNERRSIGPPRWDVKYQGWPDFFACGPNLKIIFYLGPHKSNFWEQEKKYCSTFPSVVVFDAFCEKNGQFLIILA